MFSKLKRLSLPVYISPRVNGTESILNWGSDFYYIDTSRTFYLSMPKSPILVKRIKVLTREDVYANEFYFYGSYDNNTWNEIIKKGSLCAEENILDYHKKSKKCKPDTIRYVDAEKQDSYYYYFKFVMVSNTFYESETSLYRNLIAFNGFDIIGSFLSPYICSIHHHRCFNKILLFAILISH